MLKAIVFATICMFPGDSTLDLESLKNLMDGLQADLKDVEFVYEGELRAIHEGSPGLERPRTFQGTFAYRSDGATSTDFTTHDPDPRRPPLRRIICLEGGGTGKLEELVFQPDRGRDASRLKAQHGGIPSVAREGSPMRFLLVPVLLEYLRDTGGYRTGNKMVYESPGWEAIGGHRCLKVRLYSETRFESGPLVEELYWIDLERGGTVLKHEYRYQGRLWLGVDGIELTSFAIEGGRSFWLPVRGVLRTYVLGKRSSSGLIETSSRPVFEEDYAIVNGTARLNQNLPDRRFTIDWSEAARAPFQSARSRQGATRKAIRGLDVEVVGEADRQKRELEASAPSRESFSLTTIGVCVLLMLGLALLGGTFLLKWKGR